MIYLDNAATTPLRPEVKEAMEPYGSVGFGNPSGLHGVARAARLADEAREELSCTLGCEPSELLFTSGGTEADNLAVTGAALGALRAGAAEAIVCCSAVEHPAVLEPVRFLGGVELPVDGAGRLDLELARSVLQVERDGVVLVSVMLANNETGVVEPLGEVAALARELVPSALVHTDAVQGLGWRDVAEETAPADLVSLSAHKVGGPRGVGALIARGEARKRLVPLLRGGPQERELRAGTENVGGAVGFARAAALAEEERVEACEKVGRLADRLLTGLSGFGGAHLAGEGAERLPGIVNVGFGGVDSEELLLLLDQAGVAASAGSACASGALDPSPVLLAMGLEAAAARSHVRFSLGRATTAEEIDGALLGLGSALQQLRP